VLKLIRHIEVSADACTPQAVGEILQKLKFVRIRIDGSQVRARTRWTWRGHPVNIVVEWSAKCDRAILRVEVATSLMSWVDDEKAEWVIGDIAHKILSHAPFLATSVEVCASCGYPCIGWAEKCAECGGAGLLLLQRDTSRRSWVSTLLIGTTILTLVGFVAWFAEHGLAIPTESQITSLLTDSLLPLGGAMLMFSLLFRYWLKHRSP